MASERNGDPMFDIRDLFAGEKRLAALDIGSSSIKLAEIQDTAKGYVLRRFSQMPLARGAIIDGAVVEPKVLTATIRELYKQSGCKQKRVVTSLSGHSVIVKKVTFDRMDETELQDLIRDEAAKYLPFDDMTAVNYDCQILGDNAYNPSQMDVLIVVAKKEIIESYTEAIEESGLTPVIMDVDSFALETLYEESYAFDQNEIAVLVNIGASITSLNVVKGGASIFTRDFTIGGNFVTEAIAQKMGISFEAAEEAKIAGVGEDEAARAISRAGLIAYADMICSEIERSIDYFRSTFGGEIISQVLLAGGGALIPGLSEDLSRRLGLEVEMINPFMRIAYNKQLSDEEADHFGPIAAVGMGLALRKIGDKA